MNSDVFLSRPYPWKTVKESSNQVSYQFEAEVKYQIDFNRSPAWENPGSQTCFILNESIAKESLADKRIKQLPSDIWEFGNPKRLMDSRILILDDFVNKKLDCLAVIFPNIVSITDDFWVKLWAESSIRNSFEMIANIQQSLFYIVRSSKIEEWSSQNLSKLSSNTLIRRMPVETQVQLFGKEIFNRSK